MSSTSRLFGETSHLPLDEGRAQLREKMDINRYLAHRECFHVANPAVHCEYFAADVENAPVLVFLPGMGTYCELYAELLFKLSRVGFNVVGVDYPGHGYSEGSRGRYDVAAVTRAVSLVIDKLEKKTTGSVYVYGYSIGSLLAVACAERDERISAVVCGTLLLPEIAPDFLHSLGWQWTWGVAQLFPGLKLPLKSMIDYEQLLAGHPAAKEINQDPLIVFDYPLATLASLFSWRSSIRKCEFPFRLLVIHGEKDEVLPVSYSENVAKQVAHPIEISIVPGGHMLPWDAPDLLVAKISSWLKST
jgi:pimeloyl-ACP methyl ester carboxylesterase